MAKFITVLNSKLDLKDWEAIQQADNLPSIESNKFYTAGQSKIFKKHPEDEVLGTKQVVERSTQAPGSATIIKLASPTSGLIKLASNNATKSSQKKLIS